MFNKINRQSLLIFTSCSHLLSTHPPIAHSHTHQTLNSTTTWWIPANSMIPTTLFFDLSSHHHHHNPKIRLYHRIHAPKTERRRTTITSCSSATLLAFLSPQHPFSGRSTLSTTFVHSREWVEDGMRGVVCLFFELGWIIKRVL